MQYPVEFRKVAFKATFLYTVLLLTLTLITACTEGDNKHKPQNLPSKENINKPSGQQFSNNTLEGERSASSSNSNEPLMQLMLSTKFEDENTQSQSSFNCDQKVFAVVTLHNYQKKTHNITVNWLDPHDKKRESTQIPVYPIKPITYTWASLALHRDATAGMLQWINPAAGMEEFIGEWQVKVLIDNELVESKKFTVVC